MLHTEYSPLNGNTDILVLPLAARQLYCLMEHIWDWGKNVSNINIDLRYYMNIWKYPPWGFPRQKTS